MIKQIQDVPDDVVAVVCSGRVTKTDYDDVLVPAVEKTLSKHKRARLYYEISPDFAGIAPGAMWEDFKIGIEHLARWERIAVVSDVEWITHTLRLFAFLMPGVTRIFPTSQAKDARAWIAASDSV